MIDKINVKSVFSNFIRPCRGYIFVQFEIYKSINPPDSFFLSRRDIMIITI